MKNILICLRGPVIALASSILTYFFLIMGGIIDAEKHTGKNAVIMFAFGIAVSLVILLIEKTPVDITKKRVLCFDSDNASIDEITKNTRRKEITRIRMLQFSGVFSAEVISTLIKKDKIADNAIMEIIIACPKIIPTEYQARRIAAGKDRLKKSEEFSIFRTKGSDTNNNIYIKYYNFDNRNYPSLRARCYDFNSSQRKKSLLELSWHTYDTNESVNAKGMFQVSGINPLFVYMANDEKDYLYSEFDRRFNNYWNESLTEERLLTLDSCKNCDVNFCNIRRSVPKI